MTDMRPLSIATWPQAILHIDGDSFFAACEQATHSEYRDQPLVVGSERGIATAMSREAKVLGIGRGDQIYQIKREYPDCIIVPSDYETYSLYSQRMFAIVRRHTPTVEEYSIDECFADLTGLRSQGNKSYAEIAQEIKADLTRELGITFSAGLAPSKVVAKVATSWRKPDGFTAIAANQIHFALKELPVGKVWGIGPQTASLLNKYGIKTALEFARQSEAWVKKNLNKPQLEIYQELRGESVLSVETQKVAPKSINKTKTFTPASKDRAYVFSQLSKNVENACIRARRHGMYTNQISFFLKQQDFTKVGHKLKLSQLINTPTEILTVLRQPFANLFKKNVEYRGTGVRLSNLVHKPAYQPDLFREHVQVERMSNLFSIIDDIDARFGKHSIYLGSSLLAITKGNYQGARGELTRRRRNLLRGETARQRIALPYLGTVT